MIRNWNEGWLFYRGDDAPVPVCLPHDAMLLEPRDAKCRNGVNSGYFPGGKYTYEKHFQVSPEDLGQFIAVRFDGVYQNCTVSVNAKRVGNHFYGFTPFEVDISQAVHVGENVIRVFVDNSLEPNCRWYTGSGIYRPVHLLVVPKAHFALDYHGAPGLRITPVLSADLKTAEIHAEAWVAGTAQSVQFTLGEETLSAAVTDGKAEGTFKLENVHLWDGVNDPYLYKMQATLDSGDAVEANFGCRTIAFDAEKGFILNGRPYRLCGAARHQDRQGLGNALTEKEHDEDMALLREMGANTVRLAHYQHAQAFYDLCDEKGVVIWAEIPYITMHMHNGRANTLTQMEELIVQNYNHPCIAVWGLSNEITAASPVNEELLENHRALNELAHKLDPTRPTTMANVFMLEITSPILEIPDVNSYNLYFGWYLGELDQNDDFFDTYHAKYPDRCIGFSEYGADANPAYQSAHPEKGDYTETYQCVYHEHMAKMIADRPWLWATHVWNMFDFAADGRDEGGKNGENQKGLVTFDRKIKKDAFYLYKAYWSKQPFVHTCGSRYVDRTEDVTEVRVYSNLPEVSLYKDGHLVETKKGDKVFVFNVPITGKHSIEARAGAYSSVILVNRAAEPNPAYAMSNRQVVNNWFDGELDETCWSVKDNMAAAMADAKVGPV